MGATTPRFAPGGAWLSRVEGVLYAAMATHFVVLLLQFTVRT